MERCIKCDNSGIYLKPNNEELYDKVFDRYDDMGIFTLSDCEKKALDEVGYTAINPCPFCHKSPEDYAAEKENK